jgi:hypothetical protein
MPFTGLGAGTVGDPYQIDTLARFREINAACVGAPVFTGTGTNNLTATVGANGHDLTATSTFTIEISNAGGGLADGNAQYNGTGYNIGDVLYVDGGTPGNLGEVTVYDNNGGRLYGADITKAGSGHTTGSKTTTAKTGGGSGGTFNVTSVTGASFKWKKDAGAFSGDILITPGSPQTLSNGITITFATSTGHVLADNWVVTVTPKTYFKQMNDLDWDGLTTYALALRAPNFNGVYDGDGHEMLNVTTGVAYAWGFEIQSGCTVKNLTFRISNSINNNETDKERILFGKAGFGSRANVTLTGLKIITSGTGQLWWFSDADFQSSCTLNDIVFEGNIQTIFYYAVRGTIENIKVLKTSACSPFTNTAIVGTLFGTMKYCQMIILDQTRTEGYSAALVNYLASNAVIQESWAYVKMNNTTVAVYNHGLAREGGGTGSDNTEIKDCYIKGSLSLSGGQDSSGTSQNFGKSGLAIIGSGFTKVNRCVANLDLITPLYDNRTVMVRDTNSRSFNNYYKTSALSTLTPVDEAGIQEGLDDAEFIDQASYNTFDFVNIWDLPLGGEPELRNNPLYPYETPIVSVSINSITRNSGTEIEVSLSTAFTNDFGVDLCIGNDIQQTSTNDLNPIFVIPSIDALFTVKPYYRTGIPKVYTTPVDFQFYASDAAVMPIQMITVDGYSVMGVAPIGSNLIHGTLIYNGTAFGGTRNNLSYTDGGLLQGNRKNATLTQTEVANINNTTIIEIKASDKPDIEIGIGQFSQEIEQIVECGGYIYGLFSAVYPHAGTFLFRHNPAMNMYTVFGNPNSSLMKARASAGIATDGTYLYWADYTLRTIVKVDPAQFDGIVTKYNTSFNFVFEAEYDDTTQGGSVLGGYSPNYKGEVHSWAVDGEHLYAAYTTDRDAATDVNGYCAALGITTFELHKISKDTMTAAGFVQIPKGTDDMTHNATHIFFGIEIQPGANVATYGYGWGAFAVKKADLFLTALPKLHSRDNVPSVQSYASLIYGNYLFDLRTDTTTYVLDASDVDNWTTSENVGSRTLYNYRYDGLGPYAGLITNELQRVDSNTFIGYLWGTPSVLTKFDVPFGTSSVPIVETLDIIYL